MVAGHTEREASLEEVCEDGEGLHEHVCDVKVVDVHDGEGELGQCGEGLDTMEGLVYEHLGEHDDDEHWP